MSFAIVLTETSHQQWINEERQVESTEGYIICWTSMYSQHMYSNTSSKIFKKKRHLLSLQTNSRIFMEIFVCLFLYYTLLWKHYCTKEHWKNVVECVVRIYIYFKAFNNETSVTWFTLFTFSFSLKARRCQHFRAVQTPEKFVSLKA